MKVIESRTVRGPNVLRQHMPEPWAPAIVDATGVACVQTGGCSG